MINDFCLFIDDAVGTLSDAYQMQNWDMTWREFLIKAVKEFNDEMTRQIRFAKEEEEEE